MEQAEIGGAADILVPEPRFTVRLAGRTEEGGRLVEVLDRGEPCGRFERNYWSAGPSTFAPFMVGGRWFALYSPDYTGTRIMSLPDCRDLGGEEPDACGFCPVELWVPAYRLLSRTSVVLRGTGVEGEYAPEDHRFHEALLAGSGRIAEAEARIAAEASAPGRRLPGERVWDAELSPWRWCPFGFVAGCIWGDDTSLKVEFLDLSRAAEAFSGARPASATRRCFPARACGRRSRCRTGRRSGPSSGSGPWSPTTSRRPSCRRPAGEAWNERRGRARADPAAADGG